MNTLLVQKEIYSLEEFEFQFRLPKRICAVSYSQSMPTALRLHVHIGLLPLPPSRPIP